MRRLWNKVDGSEVLYYGAMSVLLSAIVFMACTSDNTTKNETELKIQQSLAFSRDIDERLICAWSNKYSLCICGYGFPYREGVLVVVPNNRCGHD